MTTSTITPSVNGTCINAHLYSKVDVPNLVTYPNWIPIFEWYVVWCGFKNGHQKDICLKEIGLRAQNINQSKLNS